MDISFHVDRRVNRPLNSSRTNREKQIKEIIPATTHPTKNKFIIQLQNASKHNDQECKIDIDLLLQYRHTL